MGNRKLVATVALCLIPAAGIVYTLRQPEPKAHTQKKPVETSGDELRALKAEVAALRRKTQNNSRNMNELRAETGRISDAVAEATAQPETAEEEPPAEQGRPDPNSEEYQAWKADRQVLIAETESNFQLEPRDAEWSTKTAANIQEAAMKHGAAEEVLRNVDCRSTTCRIEVVEGADKTDELQQFLLDCSMMFPSMIADHIQGPDNESSYIMYLKSDA